MATVPKMLTQGVPKVKKSTMIIVGAKGYLGSALIARANTVGNVLGTSSTGGNGLLALRLDAPADFEYDTIRHGDLVLLTAAISAPDICAREHERAWSVNVTGTSAFISRAIERGARVIFFSSDTVYGEREDAFDEGASCNPAGEYALMKHEVEQRFAGNPGFKAIRLSYVFSREDKFTRYLAGCAKNDAEAELFHPFYRAIIHRDDVVCGVLALAEQWEDTPESIINFGGPQVLSRVDFVECLRANYLKNLRFQVTQPDSNFFINRPRVIAMTSPVLARLLGRTPHSLGEAAQLESAS